MAKFEIYQDSRGGFRFRLKAKNGQTILSSEAYIAKSACYNGIESVKKNATDDSKYDRLRSWRGSSYFNLRAGNNAVIGTSEMYSSESAMENGIASVKSNAPSAQKEDLT